MLGANGNPDIDQCVEDPLWNRDVYGITWLCSDREKALNINCCLKRNHAIRGHIPSADDIVPHIYSYHRWRDFQDAMVKEHTWVHVYIAHSNESHMFGHNAACSNLPFLIFFVQIVLLLLSTETQ